MKQKKNNKKNNNKNWANNSNKNKSRKNNFDIDETRIYNTGYNYNSYSFRPVSEKDKSNTNKMTVVNNKNKKAKSKNKSSKKHSKASIIIKIIIVLILALIVVGAGIVVGMLYGMWGQDFEISENELEIKGNSVIFDAEGNVLAELSGDENRKIITLENMSEYLPKAYVAIEDERFYKHSGVDFKRTAGAIANYIIHHGSSSYGGSTITQQLVKNLTGDDAKTGAEGVTRKIKEWAKAYQVERMLSKDQILELYLNIVFVGAGNSGVQVGSEYYFSKDAKDLSLEECAFLAGINNAPNSYNPFNSDSKYGKDDEKTDLINNRTKTVLSKMLELGYIKQDQYDKAVKNVDKGLKFKNGSQKSVIYSYHTDATISQLISDLIAEKNWSEDYAKTYVYGGGLKIYSTEEADVQEELEKVMGENASTYQITSRTKKDSDGKYQKSQAAMVIIDNDTGYVVGVYGGLGEKTTSRGFNRATQATRSTGSTIKPLADILPGLQEKTITLATRYEDYKTDFDNGKYTPKDDVRYYNTSLSIRQATARSQNVPFVKVIAELTNSVSTSYLEKLGVTTLDKEKDIGLSLGIGGLYNGISPLEMAGAYATIANNGIYRKPLFYTKVVDNNGNTILEPKQETHEVCSEQNAYLVKDVLTSVVDGAPGYSGTAPYCKISGIDVAAKTGTSSNDEDRWLCGFTNYYTAATWYGYDSKEEVKIGGLNPAGRIWDAVMTELHSDKPKTTFEKPSGVVSVKICSETGLKAKSTCKSTYTEYFTEDNIPDECDQGSTGVKICKSTNLLANEYCPEVITRYYSYILPKERLGLWVTHKENNGAPTKVCTEHNEDTAKQSASAPRITLVGSSTMTLNVGETYSEQGAKATDPTDGDLTSSISISGSVNTSKAGTYYVTYTVKNSLGKTAKTTRTIKVKGKTSTPSESNNTNTNSNTNSNNTTNTDNSSNTSNNTNNTSKKPDDNKTTP